MKSYYEVLGISRESDQTEIKKAYFNLVRKFPPDRFQKEFIEIRKAYETLSDPKTREDYDKFNAIPKEAMKLYDLAMAYKKRGREDKAIQILESIHGEVLQHIVLQEELAELYMENGNTQKAIRILENMVKLEPSNAGFATRLGEAYAARTWFRKAMAELERAVLLDPDNTSSWQAIIACALDYSGYHVSKMYVKRALDVSEANGWNNTDIYLQAIKNACKADDFQAIEEHLQIIKTKLTKDVEDKENIAWLLNYAGYTVYTNGYIEMAQDALELAVMLLPEEEFFLENKKIVDKDAELLRMLDELIDKNKISPVLGKIFEVTLRAWKYKNYKKQDFFWEAYYFTDIPAAVSEVRSIKQHYPKLFEFCKDYFNDILSKEIELSVPFLVKELILDKRKEKSFMEFVAAQGLSTEKALDLLERAKKRTAPAKQESSMRGRNDPCPCGSGKKYKKCCLKT